MDKKIGAQLYTVRNYCENLDSFADTLKRIADIGYKNVQVSGTCAYEPQWLKIQLEKTGLKCVVTHTPPTRLIDEAVEVAKEHSVFDCDRVGLGYHFFDEQNPQNELNDFIDKYSKVADTLAENGKYFMYHNHDREFIKYNGKPIIEHLAESFVPQKLGFIVDTYWVQNGGGDPAYWIEKLSGRVPCIHLKDYSYGGKMAVIGEGNIHFDRVFEKAEAAGTQYMLVEQDDSYGEDPLECLKRSYQFLKSRGFR